MADSSTVTRADIAFTILDLFPLPHWRAHDGPREEISLLGSFGYVSCKDVTAPSVMCCFQRRGHSRRRGGERCVPCAADWPGAGSSSRARPDTLRAVEVDVCRRGRAAVFVWG